MTVEEYIDAVALGNSLPGPIAAKLAALIEYKVGGMAYSSFSSLRGILF